MSYKITQWDEWKNDLVKTIIQDPEKDESLMHVNGICDLVDKLADMDDGRGAAYHLVEAIQMYLDQAE